MNEAMNHLEKSVGSVKSNAQASNKKNSSVAKNTKKHLAPSTLLDISWEWENNPEYDEFWKSN